MPTTFHPFGCVSRRGHPPPNGQSSRRKTRPPPTARTPGSGEVLAACSATVPADKAICYWRMALNSRCADCLPRCMRVPRRSPQTPEGPGERNVCPRHRRRGPCSLAPLAIAAATALRTAASPPGMRVVAPPAVGCQRVPEVAFALALPPGAGLPEPRAAGLSTDFGRRPFRSAAVWSANGFAETLNWICSGVPCNRNTSRK